MLRVRTSQAEEGMVLAMPVYHPERPDTVLLRTGFRLDEHGIRRLQELCIPEFWAAYPGLEFIRDQICPHVLEERGKVARVMGDVFERLANDAREPLNFGKFKATVTGLTDKLLANPVGARYMLDVAEGPRALVRHSSEVCYIALLVGLRLEWYLINQRKRVAGRRAKDVVNLGVASLLHDIGMLDLEPDVLERWQRELDESDPAWQQHVEFGYRRVKGGLDATALAAIRHHHQHFDGSGFPVQERRASTSAPRGLKGSEIHVFARILCAADLFERLRHPPGSDSSVPVVRVHAHLMREPYVQWIDPVIRKALLSVAPPYAPGSIATLDDGTRVVVMESEPADPCRPRCCVLSEGNLVPDHAAPADTRVIDLREDTARSIATIDGEDVGNDNFYADAEDDFLCLSPTERILRKGRRIDRQSEAA